MILQGAVRAQVVVIIPPPRQFLPHILERDEDGDVQTLIAEPPIETFDEPILDRLAGPNDVQLNPMAIRPGIHGATGNSPPLSTVMERGVPRWRTLGSQACATCSPVRD